MTKTEANTERRKSEKKNKKEDRQRYKYNSIQQQKQRNPCRNVTKFSSKTFLKENI